MKMTKFTLVEMLVVISIIAVLAAMLMPAIMNAIDSARTISCSNQLKQIGYTVDNYLDSFAGRLPGQSGAYDKTYRWAYAFSSNAGAARPNFDPLWACPNYANCADYDSTLPYSLTIRRYWAEKSSATPTSTGQRPADDLWSKTVNDGPNLFSATFSKNPSRQFLIADGGAWERGNRSGMITSLSASGNSDNFIYRHTQSTKANLLFLDYHVESMSHAEIQGSVNTFWYSNQ